MRNNNSEISDKCVSYTYLVVSEGEIQPHYVHASVEQSAHLLLVVAARSQRSNDARLALLQVHILKDVLEANARRVLTSWFTAGLNHFKVAIVWSVCM